MIRAIITLYNPQKKNIENVLELAKQVNQVLVCDNSKISNKLYFNYPNIYYYSSHKNLGLSMAFNKVLKNEDIQWDNNDFIFFFDQDSTISNDYIKNMIKEYNLLLSSGFKVGCLGPIYFNNSSNSIQIPKMKTSLNNNSYSVKSIITSSMLTTYRNIKDINFWNEEIFLDMADWDLCWRFIDKGYLCCITDKIVLNHTLGEGDRKFLFIRVKNSAPIREYYQTRDCLYLLKKKYVPLKFKIRFIAMITLRPLLHIIFLKNKMQRIYYIRKGIIDYFNNKHGEIFKMENDKK